MTGDAKRGIEPGMLTTPDIVIAGGGPTGLMLACELRLAGVAPVVLERLAEPSGLSKALALTGRAVDALDIRGLLPRFSAGIPAFDPGLAHFGGVPLDLGRLLGRPPRHLFIQQARTEALLEERARELGAPILRGHELIGLHQDEDGVTVDVRGPAGEYALRARYLVGCDGGSSLVRKLAGVPFLGTEPTALLRLGDVQIPGLADGARPPFGVVPLGSGIYRVITKEPYPPGFNRSVPMTLEELRESARRVFGVDLPLREPRWLSRFTDASRQAERYRAGRVFLAGDAAHIHLPAGGPGLSTGLQDAANLGWKLAAAVQGWAPPGLLDTYHAERHPVGQRVLMHTRAQGALTSPGEHAAALRALFGELLGYEQVLRHLVDLLGGYDTRYPVEAVSADPHPLLGGWLPDLALVTPGGRTSAWQLLHRARGVLLDLTGRAALRETAEDWADRLDVVPAESATQPAPARALLVRPDGYVAWVAAADGPDEATQTSLRGALNRWFGAARPAGTGRHAPSARERQPV